MAVEGDGRGREESCRLAITAFSLAGANWESFWFNQPAFPVRPTCLGGQSRSHLADGQYLTVARARRTNHWRTPLPSRQVLAEDNVNGILYFINVNATLGTDEKENTEQDRRRKLCKHGACLWQSAPDASRVFVLDSGRATTVMHAWNPSRGRRDP